MDAIDQITIYHTDLPHPPPNQNPEDPPLPGTAPSYTNLIKRLCGRMVRLRGEHNGDRNP